MSHPMTLLWHMLFAGITFAVPLATGVTLLVRRLWINAARKAALDQVLRGNRVATAQELAALTAFARKHGAPIMLGGVAIPTGDETRHMLLAGRSGSGKTTALRQIAQRGEHALVFDADGSYVERFYQLGRGDIILNPWDRRSARWNPLTDVHDIADARRIAAVLVPKPQGLSEGAIWYEQARAVLAQVMVHLVGQGRTGLAAMLTGASVDELRTVVAGMPAARAFEPGAEKATASVLFMLTGAASIVATLASVPASAAPFSFDRFYRELDRHEGLAPMVFLAAPRRVREAAAPIVAAWVDAAASTIFQRPLDTAPKAWLVLDELASLPPMQSLLSLLPEGKKFHACIVIAFQSIAQLQQAYGQEGTQVVTGQTATQVLMATGDTATAKWAVDLLGTVEVETQRPTDTLGADKDGRGSLATARERKTLVIDAELAGLGIGQAYLRLSNHPPGLVAIDPPEDLPAIAPDHIPVTPALARVATASTPALASRIEDRDDWWTGAA
jgi:type IV secretory pathway TraG/TraD family ATPase VirD4